MAWLAGYTAEQDKEIHLLILLIKKKEKNQGSGGGDTGEKL